MRIFSILCLITLFFWNVDAQTALQCSVRLQAKAQENPTAIELSWGEDAGANSYRIFRKTLEATSWGSQIASTAGTTYVDTTVQEGMRYDYRVVKYGNGYLGYGYARAGVRANIQRDRGGALILVETEIYLALLPELRRFKKDLDEDGYRTVMLNLTDSHEVADIKGIIEGVASLFDDLTTLVIIGHIPVPYSGNLAPDGHVPDHQGAWPADVYYADLDGTWTDNSINNTSANDPRNDNVPGDGKFDQSVIPGNGEPELMIGRIDMRNLSHFSKTEVELTKEYLDRVHAYKQAEWTLPKRGLIDDNFGGFGGEAFASNGWRNFAPMVGKDSIFTADYRSTMASQGYLFSYGCGGGSHESASGIGTSTQLVGDSLLTGFTMLFGSYFGDWDRQNNFLRSALAQGRTMTISWAGRPWWHYYPLGSGESIGACAKLTQGNNNLYESSYGARFVHVAQLGDPSLRMEYIAPPTNLTADTVDTLNVQLNWTSSPDQEIDGYYVYRRQDKGPWERRSDVLTETSYLDQCLLDTSTYEYQVVATKLVDGCSGSYYNESLGVMDTVLIFQRKYPDAQITSQPSGISIQFTAQASCTDQITWIFPDTTVVGSYSFMASLEQTGMTNTVGVQYQVVVSNRCYSDTIDAFATGPIPGVEELGVGFKVFPNPIRSGQTLHIELEGRHGYRIYDLQGGVVAQGAIQQKTLAIGAIRPGTYLLTFDDIEGAIPLVVMP